MGRYVDGLVSGIKDFFSGINVPEDILPDTPTLPPKNEPNENVDTHEVDEQVPTQNPQNDTSTCQDGLPCERSIEKAYFAQEKKVRVPIENSGAVATVTYIVKSGDTLSKIAAKYKGVSYKDIAKKNGISAPKYNISIGQTLIIPNQVATEEKIIYQKISKASLGAKVFLVVDTKGFKNGQSVNIKIYEKEKMLVPTNKELPFLKGSTQQTEAIAVVKIDPKTNKQQAVVEIRLRPKIDKKVDDKANSGSLEAWKEKFKKGENDKEEKKDYLWLKVSDLQGKVDEKEFLRGGELEVYAKSCGEEYRNSIRCTRYGKAYGPIYIGSEKLKDYAYWSELIDSNQITIEEKEILIGMSTNEGNLDTVHSYDSEILTVGAMQKTINSMGKGEFPIQVQAFKISYPDKYFSLFENCGWTVENNIMYYKNPDDSKSKKVTGKILKSLIREGFEKNNFGKYVQSKPLESIIKASKDKDFQAQQLKDFIDRLRNKVLPIKPSLKDPYTLEDYLKSKLGKATVLDHHVNRPGYVKTDFKNALERFFKNNPTVSRNPYDWSFNHAKYERIILDDYGNNRRGTDMAARYKKLVKAFE